MVGQNSVTLIQNGQSQACVIIYLSSSSNTLTCDSFSGLTPGALYAQVTANGYSSSQVQVANIVAAPVVTANSNSLSVAAQAITIFGSNFDPNFANVQVYITIPGALQSQNCSVSYGTSTMLVCSNLTGLETGRMFAVVTCFGGTSGAQVEVADIVQASALTSSTSLISILAASITIQGSYFATANQDNAVYLSQVSKKRLPAGTNPTCNVTSSTLTQLICSDVQGLALGSLYAVVESYGGYTPKAQIGTVVSASSYSINNHQQNSPSHLKSSIHRSGSQAKGKSGIINVGGGNLGIPAIVGIAVAGGVALFLILLVILIILIVIIVISAKKKAHGMPAMDPTASLGSQRTQNSADSSIPMSDIGMIKIDTSKFVVKFEELQVIQQLATGSFGVVYKASWKRQLVAVKVNSF